MSSKFSSGLQRSSFYKDKYAEPLWRRIAVRVAMAALFAIGMLFVIALLMLGNGHGQTQVKPNRDIAWPAGCNVSNPYYNIFTGLCGPGGGSVVGPGTTTVAHAAVWADTVGGHLGDVPFSIDSGGNTSTPGSDTAQNFVATGPPWGWDATACNNSVPTGFGASGHWSVWCQIISGNWQLWAGLNGGTAFQIGNGTGSGTVNPATIGQVAIYLATGASVSGDPNLDDGVSNANALTYNGSGGIDSPNGGKYGGASSGLLNVWELQSNQPNPASSGLCFICMARGDQVGWRNWGNTGNNYQQLCGLSGGLPGVSNDAPCYVSASLNTGVQQAMLLGLTSPRGTIGIGTGSNPPIDLPFGMLTGYNSPQNNYLSNFIAAADTGATVHAVGIVIGDSTVAGSNASNAPATNNITSWAQAVATSGTTPKLAEMIQGRMAQKSGLLGGSGYGGAGWITTFTSVNNGGQAVPLGTSVALLNVGDWTQAGHDGSTTLCPDDTDSYNATVNDTATYTDSNTSSMTYYARNVTNGGSFACNFDSGGFGSNVSTSGTSGMASCTMTWSPPGSHTLVVKTTVLGTGSTGVHYCGVRSQNTASTATFEIEKWGSGGAEINNYNAVPQSILTALSIDPAFVMIETGPNEYHNGDRTPAQVQTDLHTLKTTLNTVWPNASVIFVMPQRDYRSSGSGATYDQYMVAIQAQADADGVTLIDLYHQTSNSTQIAAWNPCPYSTPQVTGGICGSVHMDEQGNVWLANLAYQQLIPNMGTDVGYGWNTLTVPGVTYTLQSTDFSSPTHLGNALFIQGITGATVNLPTPPLAPACVLLMNSNSSSAMTVHPGSLTVDGNTADITLVANEWLELCTYSGNYKSRGRSSRNRVTATAPLFMSAAQNATAQDRWGNLVTNFANIVYAADTTITFSSSTTDVTVNVEAPTVATAYLASFVLSQTTVNGASCTGNNGVSVQLNWTDNFSGQAISGANNVGWRAANGAVWTTAGAASENAATSLSASTVYYSLTNFPIYDQASAQVSFVIHVASQATGCASWPVFKVHATFTK